MKPSDWARAYQGSLLPHWAEDLRPSPLAEEMLKMFSRKSAKRILEIGVGSGRDSIYFAAKGNEVVGIDIVPRAVELAIKNAKQVGLAGKVDFRIGNAEKLEFSNCSFDGVYSISVLHATNLSLSLKEISRVLKDGGKSIIYLYESTIEDGNEYRFVKRDDLKKWLGGNSLQVIDSWNFVHEGHEGEKTTVLVYKLTKIRLDNSV